MLSYYVAFLVAADACVHPFIRLALLYHTEEVRPLQHVIHQALLNIQCTANLKQGIFQRIFVRWLRLLEGAFKCEFEAKLASRGYNCERVY